MPAADGISEEGEDTAPNSESGEVPDDITTDVTVWPEGDEAPALVRAVQEVHLMRLRAGSQVAFNPQVATASQAQMG